MLVLGNSPGVGELPAESRSRAVANATDASEGGIASSIGFVAASCGAAFAPYVPTLLGLTVTPTPMSALVAIGTTLGFATCITGTVLLGLAPIEGVGLGPVKTLQNLSGALTPEAIVFVPIGAAFGSKGLKFALDASSIISDLRGVGGAVASGYSLGVGSLKSSLGPSVDFVSNSYLLSTDTYSVLKDYGSAFGGLGSDRGLGDPLRDFGSYGRGVDYGLGVDYSFGDGFGDSSRNEYGLGVDYSFSDISPPGMSSLGSEYEDSSFRERGDGGFDGGSGFGDE